MKIFLDMIGCRLNQAEIESYARQFRALGHELVAEASQADLAVVNTCSVTAAAASDSRSTIRRIYRSGVGEIIATGCWATLSPERAAQLPGVSRVISNLQKDRLVSLLLKTPEEKFELEPLERQPVPGARLRTRAFVKVQDGCDNRCTFCVTTLARGKGRSRTIEEIVNQVNALLLQHTGQDGVKEVVLTGVHLGSWGKDLSPQRGLEELVSAILERTDVPRLRLSSLEPWNITPDFFDLWKDSRLCRHLHLPLQSGCATTLRRMARKTTPKDYDALVEAARAAVPDIAITTDVITGFPGETEEEFEQSLAFVRHMAFSGGHVFTYSERPGTAAAGMPHQVPHALRKERNARMRAVLAESSRRYQRRFLGKVLPVLWESATALGPDGWRVNGLTDNYLRVQALAPQSFWNQITPVALIRLNDQKIYGSIVSSG